LTVSTFVDAGTVRDRWQDLNLNNKFSLRAGLQCGTNYKLPFIIKDTSSWIVDSYFLKKLD
jgi:hypothetical protein